MTSAWRNLFIKMALHLDSLWNRGTRELENGLLEINVQINIQIICLRQRRFKKKERPTALKYGDVLQRNLRVNLLGMKINYTATRARFEQAPRERAFRRYSPPLTEQTCTMPVKARASRYRRRNRLVSLGVFLQKVNNLYSFYLCSCPRTAA